ncbi:hypothetical protein [Anabaena lutea]|uniref:Uncharacterized protein n=1 Tax=Anabaena lutea FACHB-196 TaxID=2692881 RepID=A0ABR8FNG2_9NOST|nr:hypothetical protein [Anabaena lutea]MBD2571349.1 hypothetical protein [Anabaena lutea FACHB-196]
MARRRGEKVPVFVVFSGLNYGFQGTERILKKYGGLLGQKLSGATPGVFYGCNSPKPPRATIAETEGKENTFTGSRVSSFCSADKVDSLKKANWVITKAGTIRGIKQAGVTRTVHVEMPGGYNYTWNLNKEELTHVQLLGIELTTGSTDNRVWGSSPKPPRASIIIQGQRTSTFIKPQGSVIDKAIAAGWSISGVDYDLIPNAG